MTKSGFCMWPGVDDGHQFCKRETCDCNCHKKPGGDDD